MGRLAWVWDMNRNDFSTEVEKFRSGDIQLRVQDLQLGEMLGKGANAAVHAAAWSNPAELFTTSEATVPEPEPKRIRRGSSSVVKGSFDTPLSSFVTDERESLEYPLAVKIMFNYDIMSDVGLILRAMRKETVPCLSMSLQGQFA